MGAFKDLIRASFPARGPGTVTSAIEDCNCSSDAHSRLCVEIREDGGEGRVDDEGDEEEEGEGTEAGQQGEEGCEVEAEAGPTSVLLDGENLRPQNLVTRRGINLAGLRRTSLRGKKCVIVYVCVCVFLCVFACVCVCLRSCVR